MKAAVLYQTGELPSYTDFTDPVPGNDQQLLVGVKAVAIKHFDKGVASGRHYSSAEHAGEGRVIGGDGVVILADGRRAYGMGVGGMLAEKALIHKQRMVILPPGIDDVIAAALPNAVIGAAMGLKFKARITPGDVVLINGATGFTGRVAVQLARHYGAGRVIATGRSVSSLQELTDLGADRTLTLTGNDAEFIDALKEIHHTTPIDIVIDYLWGHPAELIFAALKGDGRYINRVSYVSVGSMAGDAMQLSAATMRSVDLQLTGSGLGSWTNDEIHEMFVTILPEAFQLAAEGKLTVKTKAVNLKDIATLWDAEVTGGERLVVVVVGT